MLLSMPLAPLSKDIQIIPWQIKTAEEHLTKMFSPVKAGSLDYEFSKGLYGTLLRGGTGIGKMYITCQVIRLAAERKLLSPPPNSNCPFPVVWILPGNVLIETQRVLKRFGIQHLVHCLTYNAFRGNGNPYVEWKDVSRNGEEDYRPFWKKEWLPALVVGDEIQNCRNPETSTTKVMLALEEHTHSNAVKVLFASATPAQRLCELRCIAVVLGIITKYNNLPLTDKTFPSVMRDICAYGKNIWNYSPKNMKNFREEADLWYVEPKNVRFKFPAKTELIEIELTAEKRIKYDDAYDEYKRKIWEEQRRTGPQGMMARWVALGKFQEKAELLRCDNLAEFAVEEVKNKRQVIVGSKYVNTLRGVWLHLTKNLGVPPDEISFVVGGQTREKRQINVDAFQAGATKYMLLMMKAGGVALSLHHDRVSPFSLPRTIILPPTYAAPELVQVLGRGHRLTSLSVTKQLVIWFADTVEIQRVLPKVRSKLRCLDSAVIAKEQWGHMLEGTHMTSDNDDEWNEMQSKEDKENLTMPTTTTIKNNETTETDNNELTETEEGIEFITGEGLSNEE